MSRHGQVGAETETFKVLCTNPIEKSYCKVYHKILTTTDINTQHLGHNNLIVGLKAPTRITENIFFFFLFF